MRRGGQKVLKQTRQLLDPLKGQENTQRNSLNRNPEIVLSLHGRQRALGKIDANPKTLAEPKKKIPRPYTLLEGGSQDQPIVEVPDDPEAMPMYDHGDRGHDAGEDLRSRKKAKTESAELVDRLSHAKPEVLARRWMNRNLKVGILEIQGYQPIPLPKGLKNGLGGLHMKTGDIHKAIQAREVDHRAPPTCDLGSHKETAVKAWRRRSKLDSLLGQQAGNCSGQSQATDGRRAVARQGQRNMREKRKRAKRDLIPQVQNLHHPSIGPPTTAKSPNDPLNKPPPHRMRDMTPTVENPAYHPEEQKREQESRNGLSSQDEKESQNYDGDGEQESGKDWSASDAHHNPSRPHQPWPAENKSKMMSEYPPTGEQHQTQQREKWHQPQELPTSHACSPRKSKQEYGRYGIFM